MTVIKLIDFFSDYDASIDVDTVTGPSMGHDSGVIIYRCHITVMASHWSHSVNTVELIFCSTRSIRESVFGAIQQVWTILHVNRADIGNLGFLDILRSKQDLAFEAVSQVNSDSLPRYGD